MNPRRNSTLANLTTEKFVIERMLPLLKDTKAYERANSEANRAKAQTEIFNTIQKTCT